MTPEEFNDAYALCQLLPGPNVINLSVVFGSRIRGTAGAVVALLGLLGAAGRDHLAARAALRALRRNRRRARRAHRDRRGRRRARHRHRCEDGAAAVPRQIEGSAVHRSGHLRRGRRAALAAVLGVARHASAQHRHRLVGAPMSHASDTYIALAVNFALMSLFAIGGANAAVPEMHRLAVDVMQWMTDRQFTDMFAIAQLTPGPDVDHREFLSGIT